MPSRGDNSIGINLLKYFNTPQELADVGAATKENPGILDLPELKLNEKIAAAMNDSMRFMGTVFHDEALTKNADAWDQKFSSERESKVIQRLLPIVGQAEQERQRVAAKAKQDEAEAKRQQQRTLARENAIAKYVVQDETTGKDRPLTMSEVNQLVDELEQGAANPYEAINGPPKEGGLIGRVHARDLNAEAEKRQAHQLEIQRRQIEAASDKTGAQISAAADRTGAQIAAATKAREESDRLIRQREIDREARAAAKAEKWTINDAQEVTNSLFDKFDDEDSKAAKVEQFLNSAKKSDKDFLNKLDDKTKIFLMSFRKKK